MVYRYTLALAGSALLLALAFSSGPTGDPVQNGFVSPVPTRLKIPSIAVDAVILPVGLTPEGAMDAPEGPDDAGWFSPGKRPGEIGSAVIAGHSGWKNGIPAVFDNLSALRKGDKIYTEDAAGTRTVFVVREIRTYDPRADTKEVFTASDGNAHLNLITCEGIWDPVTESSSERLVVFADME